MSWHGTRIIHMSLPTPPSNVHVTRLQQTSSTLYHEYDRFTLRPSQVVLIISLLVYGADFTVPFLSPRAYALEMRPILSHVGKSVG
jgi:hypothetical protein